MVADSMVKKAQTNPWGIFYMALLASIIEALSFTLSVGSETTTFMKLLQMFMYYTLYPYGSRQQAGLSMPGLQPNRLQQELLHELKTLLALLLKMCVNKNFKAHIHNLFYSFHDKLRFTDIRNYFKLMDQWCVLSAD